MTRRGRHAFSPLQLDEIKALLIRVRQAPADEQKLLRATLRRRHGFYMSDFPGGTSGFVASDVDGLVQAGLIEVLDGDRDQASDRSDARTHADDARSPGSLPTNFGRRALRAGGYRGWRTWAELRAVVGAAPDRTPGTYVVFRPTTDLPVFSATSTGGKYKGRDPAVDTDRLQLEWVPNAQVVYVGKAEDVRRRLDQYARFGAGEAVGHWGGRLIWQLLDAHRLQVAWRACEPSKSARDDERQLLAHFADLHGGRRPFANLVG